MNQETTIYKVMINHEHQYSIWPADLEAPCGWNETGCTGNRQACLAYIAEIWADLKSLGLQKKMEGNKI
jgi:MbtH protein